MADVTPGKQTSEWSLAQINTYVGLGLVIVGGITTALEQVADLFPSAKWIGPVIMALGTVQKIAAMLGYSASRAQVKAAAAKVAAVALLLFAVPAYAQDVTPAPVKATQFNVGSVKGRPLVLELGVGFSGYGYDFGTKTVARDVVFSGLAELTIGDFPVSLLGGAGFQTGADQGLALQEGIAYKPLGVGLLMNEVLVGATRSYGLCAGYVLHFP